MHPQVSLTPCRLGLVKEIWWIRHGESDSNAGARTASAAAPVLTPRGWAEARSTAEVFLEPPARVITSPFIRTKQTAAPLLERFPMVPQEEWTVQEFVELSALNRNNTTPEEREPRANAYWEAADPEYCDGEGAESFRDLLGRVDGALERMRQVGDGLTVIYSHGLFMRALLWQMWRNSDEISHKSMRAFIYFFLSLQLPNCAIVRMRPQNGQWYMSPPDISHLHIITAQERFDP